MVSKTDQLQRKNSPASAAVADTSGKKGISLPAVPVLTPVQRKEGGDVVQLEGDDDAEAKKSAEELEASFDEKAGELSDKMDTAEEEYNEGNIETVDLDDAPAMGDAAADLLAELTEIGESIEERKAEVNAEYEDESTSDDRLGDLGEEIVKFDSLVPKVKTALFKADNRVTEFQGMIDLEKERREEEGAAAAALTALRALWTSPASAKGHFNKHTGDTGLSTETDYLTRAKELTAKAASGTILRKTRSGDILFYDKSNGNFAVKSSAGKIRTLFNPSGGESYYNKQ